LKRIGGLFEQLVDRGNLAEAAFRAAAGKRDRSPVRRFFDDLDANLTAVLWELEAGTYRFGAYDTFQVQDTKTRTIHAPTFRDRVLHHALIRVTGPVLEQGAIPHSFACRAGRGLHKALRYARRWTRPGRWYGKMDVTKFYDSIDHSRLKMMLRRRFREERLLHLWESLLNSYRTSPGKGLPIGALTSQYLGNFYLDPVDHAMTAHPSVCRYARYMDDMVVWAGPGESGERLREVRSLACDRLADLGLKLKHGGEWNRCDQGVPFLGFVIYPGRIRLNEQGRRRLRLRWHRLEREQRLGRISESALQERSESLFAHARTGDDAAWRRAVVRFSRIRDVQGPEPRDARGLLEQRRGQVPLGVSQQEEARQPEQQHWLPGLSGPQHGGNPPDNARSGAYGDGPGPKPKSPGGRGHPKQADGQKAEEKAPAGQGFLFADLLPDAP